MIKIIITFLIPFLLFTGKVSKPINETYYARNYIVMDAYTNEVLEGKDINDSYSVASISKIMTAIIAIERNKNLQKWRLAK